MFDLPDADNNTFYVGENEIAQEQGRDEGWTIYEVCDVDGVVIKMPVPDNDEDGVVTTSITPSIEYHITQYSIYYFVTILILLYFWIDLAE